MNKKKKLLRIKYGLTIVGLVFCIIMYIVYIKYREAKQDTELTETNPLKEYVDNKEVITEDSIIACEDTIPEITDSFETQPQDRLVGYFNDDMVLDTAWVVAPKIRTDVESEFECYGECVSYIQFSDPDIPSIRYENSIGGELVNEGDLNENGTDEIGFAPYWFTSAWISYCVWTLSNGKWIDAVEPISVHTTFQNEPPIKKDPKRKGYAIVTYSDLSVDDSDIVSKSKSVKVAK
ncbi:MAG: hypothetical protein LBG15_12110 [Dysgonamonadaceae bacterium]|jgi:hypothetical protein|nr:hypothetical protein [Dysgonamonadaceae bacterium]